MIARNCFDFERKKNCTWLIKCFRSLNALTNSFAVSYHTPPNQYSPTVPSWPFRPAPWPPWPAVPSAHHAASALVYRTRCGIGAAFPAPEEKIRVTVGIDLSISNYRILNTMDGICIAIIIYCFRVSMYSKIAHKKLMLTEYPDYSCLVTVTTVTRPSKSKRYWRITVTTVPPLSFSPAAPFSLLSSADQRPIALHE